MIIIPILLCAVIYVVPTVMAFKICYLKGRNPAKTSIQRIREPAHPESYNPHLYIPIYELPADYVRLVLYAEDSDFFHHKGFHYGYILYAVRLNRKLGYRAYGASTITQQCARTIFLTPRKTYARKAAELLISLCLEVVLSKDRILELYLNTAELGPGIYGIAEASDAYFHKTSSELDIEEMLSIVSIMPNPIDYSPADFKQNRLLKRRYHALRRFALKTFDGAPVLRSEIRKVESP